MDDVISRQAAIDALLEEVRLVDGYYVENDEVINKDDAIEAMRLLPSADVRENIHAHWIKDGYQYRCSNCGEYIYGDADATPDINKFCWNCGADMRGDKHETD